MSRQYFHLDM